MHCEVGEIDAALDAIERGWPGTLGAYPHHGGWEPPRWVFQSSPRSVSRRTPPAGWRGAAQLVGGCCGIGPVAYRGGCASSCRTRAGGARRPA